MEEQEKEQKRPRRHRRISRREIENRWAGAIRVVNTFVLFSRYREDALTEEEIEKLAHALALVTEQHPFLMQMVADVVRLSPYLVLAETVAQIAIPRIMRRMMEREIASGSLDSIMALFQASASVNGSAEAEQ